MKIKKKNAAVFCVLTAVTAVLCCKLSSERVSLDSQMMAERWRSEDTSYSQVSVFCQPVSGYSSSFADGIHSYVEKKLKEDDHLSDDENVNTWLDAYSSVFSQINVNVPGSSGNGSLCSVTGVSGEFFKFHPLELISGNYIYGEELRNDRVVIDENAAWNLFSSFDVTGMHILFGGKEYEIAGVVRPEQGKAEKTAYPSIPLIYMHYNALEEGNFDGKLLCYEAVIPNPVENYAKNIILGSAGIDTMVSSEEELQKNIDALDYEIIENSTRYSNSQLADEIKNVGKSSIVKKAIPYPYWENAARVMKTKLTVLFAAAIVTGSLAALMLLVFLFRCYLNRTWHLKDFIEDLTYKYTYKKKISDYIDISENK